MMRKVLVLWWKRWGGYLIGIGCFFLIAPFLMIAIFLYVEHIVTADETTRDSPDGKHKAVIFNAQGDPLDPPIWFYEVRGRWPWEATLHIGKCDAGYDDKSPKIIKWLDNNHLLVEAINMDKNGVNYYHTVTVDIRSPKFSCK